MSIENIQALIRIDLLLILPDHDVDTLSFELIHHILELEQYCTKNNQFQYQI
jgi:hypothetical protein